MREYCLNNCSALWLCRPYRLACDCVSSFYIRSYCTTTTTIMLSTIIDSSRMYCARRTFSCTASYGGVPNSIALTPRNAGYIISTYECATAPVDKSMRFTLNMVFRKNHAPATSAYTEVMKHTGRIQLRSFSLRAKHFLA